MKLKVGQKLWYVPNNRGGQHEVTVIKVGRMWAHVGTHVGIRGRIDMETLIADGGGYGSPGRCYLSQEHYNSELRRVRKWGELCQAMRLFNNPPKHITVDDIDVILNMVRV